MMVKFQPCSDECDLWRRREENDLSGGSSVWGKTWFPSAQTSTPCPSARCGAFDGKRDHEQSIVESASRLLLSAVPNKTAGSPRTPRKEPPVNLKPPPPAPYGN